MSARDREYLRAVKPSLPTVPRNCLKCGRVFESEGRANRICPSCNWLNGQLSRRQGNHSSGCGGSLLPGVPRNG